MLIKSWTKDSGDEGRLFHCQSLLKVLIVSWLHPSPPHQTHSHSMTNICNLILLTGACSRRMGHTWLVSILDVTFKNDWFLNFAEISGCLSGQCGRAEAWCSHRNSHWAPVRRDVFSGILTFFNKPKKSWLVCDCVCFWSDGLSE